tara:strand:- start:3807 stop:4406 length:600 start_codon:yes stop_codon:yes gene_type:complete
MKDMAIDIETSNFSYEIGGWDKTHLFDPVVVATWDGEEAHVFSKQEVNMDGVITHPLHPKELGSHLEKHIESGGRIVGHNIRGFDLPILKNALDCHYAGVLLGMKEPIVLDTAWSLRKISGNRIPLDEVCKATFGEGKVSMKSIDAPIAWREGRYDEVAKYCLEDCKLNLTLFKHGVENGMVKSRNISTGLIDEIEVIW